MKNIIVGTAGHIDHGKTTLVKALTGIDTDRLAEEKRRGITIDLGFAHLQLTPGIRIGFVDVPGHERFVRNMLAGAGGVDLVLFAVAGDESIMPQTREHFEICRLLGIREGIIAITKSDSVTSDLLDLVRLEIGEYVAGSFLQDAPIIPVSANTGSGLEDLRAALKISADRIAAKDSGGPARLPIDRSFSMRGFGTVVTGTLVSGAITRDQELELHPAGRVLRVRGIQVYGHAADRAEAGTRTALNLVGIEPREIERGMVLAERGRFETTIAVDCSLELLASARRLQHGAPVHFHSGTAEIEARIRLFRKDALPPGGTSFARLRFEQPAVLAPGDRYILRQFSPVITIGGGTIVDTRPPRERRMPKIEARLRILAGEDALAKGALLVEESECGLSANDLASRLAIPPLQALTLARQVNALVVDPPGWAVSRTWVQQRRAALIRLAQSHHAGNPLSSGVSKQEMKARLLSNAPGFLFEAVLSGVPELAVQGDRVRHRSHCVVLSGDEENARRKIESAFEASGLAAPSVPEVLGKTGVDLARGEAILRMLLKDGLLRRISGDLVFHESAIVSLKALLAGRRKETFTVSTFKEWTGISRKYAVPLLEFLDREHVTVRKGDARMVL